MTIKDIQERFISGSRIQIDKAMVPAGEWRMAMAEIQVLKDQYIWHLSEISQLQEQSTYLDKVASELQDTCDRQAKRLAQQEAVMRMALEALKTPVGYGDFGLGAIKALEESLGTHP